MMKVALVYTSTTPELIETVETEIRKQIGEGIELIRYEDASILKDAIDAGKVPAKAAARLISIYMQAVEEDAEAIINLCSSVGEVADAAQDISKYIGVPIVRVDEEMCREAVRSGKRIGVMATLSSTLNPTKNTLCRVAREIGADIELVDGLIEGAFGLDQTSFKAKMLEKANAMKSEVDVLLFAQGSMAYCEEYVAKQCDMKVLSSPRFGAKALRDALKSKGVL
jgi:hypothetical protein